MPDSNPTQVSALDNPELEESFRCGLFLVDGSGYIFRAFHALPPMTSPDGTPVNAVFGFTNMLLRLLEDARAGQLVVIFDAGRTTWRSDLYPAYKTNRPAAPPELVPQFPLIREATRAFGLPVIEAEGWEADDLIAAYARAARAADRWVTILSSDKDLMQLVGPGIQMWDPIRQKRIGAAQVEEKFGVPPDKVIDVQALAGDSVDNVPGVPGIGIKTAARLIQEFGDLTNLLARVDEIKQPGRREALRLHADMARLSRQLVTLDAECELPIALEAIKPPDADPVKLVSFLRTQGFRSLLRRFEPAQQGGGRVAGGLVSRDAGAGSREVGTDASGVEVGIVPSRQIHPVGAVRYEAVQDEDALESWIALARMAGVMAIDTETDGLIPSAARLVGVSLSCEPGVACYIPLAHIGAGATSAGELALVPPSSAGASDQPRQIPLERAIALLKPLLEDPAVLKIGHNIKFDMQVLGQHGIAISPWDDTMLLSYVMAGGVHGHGMDELAAHHLGVTTISYDQVTGTGKSRITFDRVPLELAVPYAAEDADVTLRLWRLLKPGLIRARSVGLYEGIERPLIPVIAAMERTGIRVDPTVLRDLSTRFSRRLQAIEVDIHRLAGQVFNVASTRQLGQVLFAGMGLKGGRKLKAGGYSTDSSVLEPLAAQGIEIAAKVLEWRQMAKLISTYCDALVEQIQTDGRVHTSFSMALTTTGRLSSTDPNLQNIPIRTQEGREIRAAFVAADGCRLLSVDYSQIELRLIAEMAGVTAMKEAFQLGADIHAVTASQVFGVPLGAVTPELRRRAKTINFGIIYGISGFGLAQQLSISTREAQEFIDCYLDRYHEIRDYMERTKAQCAVDGYVTTLFGRRCHIPAIREQNAGRRAGAQRQAINAPVQGTAADIIKRAMVRVGDALEAAGLSGRLVLQVHDELLFEVPEAEVEETASVVRGVMEGAAALSVPLLVEAGSGHNWVQAH